MLKKMIATTSLLLPLIVAAGAAQAGETISDKRYWPNEVTRSEAFTTRSNPNAAFAYEAPAPDFARPATVPTVDGRRYQGGPKGR
ncbi:hypothetical protein ACFQX9_38605 [Bradyrhizobium sp. GCM10028915]|uniref:hypothetical protein n=1 Tax=Bradyrhizobium sp. GCM10028915 TaxID=3273385 RepID=UPI00360C975C